MRISIGNDHAAVAYKKEIISFLEKRGHAVTNCGTDSEESVDYPDFIHPVATAVGKGESDLGIILCGSGNGAAMTANKHSKIRAALCWTEELSQLARSHNNANILSIPARFVSLETAIAMTKTFLETPFEGGRHQRRVDKISC